MHLLLPPQAALWSNLTPWRLSLGACLVPGIRLGPAPSSISPLQHPLQVLRSRIYCCSLHYGPWSEHVYPVLSA